MAAAWMPHFTVMSAPTSDIRYVIVTENIIARKDIVMESVNTSYLNRVQNYGNILKPMNPTTGIEHFTYFDAFGRFRK